MRHRPKRENYPNGKYGEIDYQERLERYSTYLENKLSKLHQPTVSEPLPKYTRKGDYCAICGGDEFWCDEEE